MADVMKKIMIFAAIAAAVLAAGCAKENLVQPEQGTVLKASLSSLRRRPRLLSNSKPLSPLLTKPFIRPLSIRMRQR